MKDGDAAEAERILAQLALEPDAHAGVFTLRYRALRRLGRTEDAIAPTRADCAYPGARI